MTNPDRPTCEWALLQAFELRDARPDAPEAGLLRAHLEACPECRRTLAWDDRLAAHLRASLPPTPAGLAEEVSRRLRRRRLLRAGVGAAAAALLAAGLLAW